MLETVGYVSLKGLLPEQLAEMITKKCTVTVEFAATDIERGFHTLRSENVDRLLPSGDMVSALVTLGQGANPEPAGLEPKTSKPDLINLRAYGLCGNN